MKIEEYILNEVGRFTWFWNYKFFVEMNCGNFIWNDPDYPGGDNTFTKTNMTFKEFVKSQNVSYGRDKGKHIIKDYCGENIILKGM